jgi:hypothetical protein
MTRKEFKEKTSYHVYGRGRDKKHALYFDYQTGKTEEGGNFSGFKFMIKAHAKEVGKPELYNILYKWVNEEIQHPPWFVSYKYAETDEKRFKVAIMG